MAREPGLALEPLAHGRVRTELDRDAWPVARQLAGELWKAFPDHHEQAAAVCQFDRLDDAAPSCQAAAERAYSHHVCDRDAAGLPGYGAPRESVARQDQGVADAERIEQDPPNHQDEPG